MKLLRRVAAEVRRGENIDAYLTIVAAVVIGILNLAGVFPAAGLTSLVLAVLALLAVGTLATRAKLEDLHTAVMEGGATPQRTLPPSFATDLAAINDVWISGVSRATLIRANLLTLTNRLRAGRTVRVLLVKPGSPAAALADRRMPIAVPGGMEREITAALDMLGALHQDCGGDLQVRLTEQEPAFGSVFVNPSTTDARLYLEYYSYKTRHDSHLCLVLTARDGDWLELFREQLTELWNDAEPLPVLRPRQPADLG